MHRIDHATQKYGLPLILVVFALLAILYDLTVPLFEKPDELKHFAVIQYIQTHHHLPLVRQGVYRPWDQEGTQPPLYHLLAAAAVSWLDLSHFSEPPRNPHYADDRSFVWRERGNNNLYLHPPGENWQLDSVIIAARLARWLSILAGLGTISLTYHLANLVFLSIINYQLSITNYQLPITNYSPLLAAALVAFLPQFLHVSSAITNDSLSVPLAAAALLLLALVIKNGGSTGYAVWLGVVLGLGAITKLSLLYLAPLIGLVFLLDWWRHRAWTRFLSHGLIISGVALLLCGWWFWRNWQLYGDATALNAHLIYRGGALDPRPSLAQIWRSELVGLELSFWAAFGAGQVLLEPWLYTLLRGVKYLVLIGLVIGLWRFVRRAWYVVRSAPSFTKNQSPLTDNHFPLTSLLLLALWSLIIFIALLRWMQITPASWGRLLFPALPALSILSVWALSQLRWPTPRQNTGDVSRFTPLLLPLFLTLSLFTLSLISPFRTIQAAYAKTPLISPAELPPDLQPLDLTYAGTLRLHGYRLGQESVLPGEWLPVTLYWQATQPIDQNYSAFVHLLDAEGQALAQSNTYPDRGRWPTSQLEPGRILADTHYVFLPSELESQAPLATRLAFGIFGFDDPSRAAKVAIDAQGQVVEPIVPGPALLPRQWPQFQPTHPLDVTFADQIQLIGFDSIHENWEPGAQVPLTLYWEALAPPGQNFNLFIHLIDPANGSQLAGFDGPPAFPTSYWQAGTTIRDSRLLTLPPDLPPGRYELRLGWYDLESFARLSTPSGDALSLLTVTVTPVESP